MPSGSARICTTETVCGWQRSWTRNVERLPRSWPKNIDIASAAAVPSSSSEALAISSPVRSLTIVW